MPTLDKLTNQLWNLRLEALRLVGIIEEHKHNEIKMDIYHASGTWKLTLTRIPEDALQEKKEANGS